MQKYSRKQHHGRQDRQWDMRFNVQREDDLLELTERIMECFGRGKLKYILIGGVEIGTKPTQDDYQVRHVHVAAIFNDPITQSALS